MINNYNYNDPNDIFLAPYINDLNSTTGIQPSAIGATCTIVTDEKPDGVASSLFCPSGQVLTYSDLPIDFSEGQDFTVDLYMRYQSGYSGITSAIYRNLANNNHFSIQPDVVGYGNSGSALFSLTKSPGLVSKKWVHYALVRKDNTHYWFVDGKLATKADATITLHNKTLTINGRYSNSFPGGPAHYSHVRISNIARWTEDFTPPALNETKKGCSCVPVGMINYYAANGVPNGWLVCNGAEVSKSTYNNLYATIGDTFDYEGIMGKESLTFKLPDLRGEFIRVFDAERGIDTGRKFGSFQLDALQDHYHGSVVAGASADETARAALPVARVADETRPRNVALVACIKF